MTLEVSLPESVTPWAAMFVSLLTLVGLLGAGSMFVWRRALWPAFKRGVEGAIAPVLEELKGIRELADKTAGSLEARTREVDGKFGSLDNRLRALEIRQSKDTEKVVQAVESVKEVVATPPGDA